METREWNCGTQCEMWGVPLVCLFHNPILVSIVAPLELGLGIHNPRFVAGPLELGLGTRSPRFVAWPLELGLGTRNARGTMINRSTVFALHCFVLPCVPIKMQGVGLLDFTLGYSTIGYLTFLFLTLPCPVSTYSSQNCKMFDKCVCGAVGELPIASLGTGLQHAFVAISPNSTTACMSCFKLAVSNAAALQSLSAATPSPQPTAAVPTTATTEPTPEMPSDEDTGFATLDGQAFRMAKLASTAARTIDGRFVSKLGHNCCYDCAQQGCGTQQWVYYDHDASYWRVRKVGICEHNTRSAYMQGTALHLPLAMTLKLQDLLGGNCPQRALALMREAFTGDPLVNKMTAR